MVALVWALADPGGGRSQGHTPTRPIFYSQERGSLSLVPCSFREGLCPAGLCSGALCPGGSLSGVSVRETPQTETPPLYDKESAVYILLECKQRMDLVMKSTILSCALDNVVLFLKFICVFHLGLP